MATTPRIRWEQERHGCLLGFVGTYKAWVFQIYRPGENFAWVLMNQMPAWRPEVGERSDAEELKAKAEELLAEFASSLGAIFPDALRQQVQQSRNDYYEAACEHSEMAGHDVQEARAFGRVSAYDDVLAMLAEAGTSSEGSEGR